MISLATSKLTLYDISNPLLRQSHGSGTTGQMQPLLNTPACLFFGREGGGWRLYRTGPCRDKPRLAKRDANHVLLLSLRVTFLGVCHLTSAGTFAGILPPGTHLTIPSPTDAGQCRCGRLRALSSHHSHRTWHSHTSLLKASHLATRDFSLHGLVRVKPFPSKKTKGRENIKDMLLPCGTIRPENEVAVSSVRDRSLLWP
jgi:hypothetical protein